MKKSIMKFILFLLRNRKHDKPARVQKCNLTEQVNRFLQNSYLFRYNLLTDETEYRPANAADKTFVTIGKRELNTLCLEAHARGILCWDKDISRFLFSKHVPEYHPFLLYFEQLPVWDGIDRITRLAQRISSESYWINGFHTWMLGLSCPMDRTDRKACQQRGSPTRQHQTGLPEIHILQKSDARQLVPLLFG